MNSLGLQPGFEESNDASKQIQNKGPLLVLAGEDKKDHFPVKGQDSLNLRRITKESKCTKLCMIFFGDVHA